MNIDLIIFQKINELAGERLWLDTLGIYFADYVGYLLILFLFVFLLINFRKYWQMFLWAAASIVLSRLIIANLIRLILPRSRPFVENYVNLLIEHVPSAAFPSGHTSFYFAIATAIFLYLKNLKKRPKFWWQISFLFFLASLVMGISRIFCGIHWPSDILVGAIVGIFSGWLINKIFQKYIKIY